MSLPVPPVPLVGECSIIYNNTLYTYSASAFQSLPLVKGAQWTKLTMGQPVSGAACVLATPKDDKSPAALYIVGGTTNSTNNYKGLQRYLFSSGQWEPLLPTTAVTQNRLNHNAVYLNTSASILVYAGSQDGSTELSSQTFTISTIAPYTVLAYESIAPPTISPLLMQWSESEAVMIGGSEDNRKVMLFSPTAMWVDPNITLANPLKNPNVVKAILLNGDDGSKNLITFDMTISPNQVNRTILIDANGNSVLNAQPIISRSLSGKLSYTGSRESINRVKRGNLTLATWPAYNATLAPTTTRNGYSVARDQSGLVIISGGNADDVLCMFKARDNSWANATALLANSSVQSTTPRVSTGIATASSSVQTSSQMAGAGSTDTTSTSSSPTQLLGAIVGSILGLVFIILAVILLFRWRQNRRRYTEAGHQRRASGIPPAEKDPMDFADRGLAFGNNAIGYQGHGQQDSQGSFSSMAILMGNVGQRQKRGVLGRRNSSNGSDSSSTFNKRYKTAISKPMPPNTSGPSGSFNSREKEVPFSRETSRPAPALAPASAARPRGSGTARRGSTRRSSGWNRYWSGGSALNILGLGSRRTTGYSSGSDRASGSQYSDSGLPGTTTHISAMPPNHSRQAGRMSRVASSNPNIGHVSSEFPLKDSMAGQIERQSSSSSASSYNNHRDTVSTGVPASVHQEQPWTPVHGTRWERGGQVPNVTYLESNYTTILPRGRPADLSTHPSLSDRRPPIQHSSDMSWLNLGAGE